MIEISAAFGSYHDNPHILITGSVALRNDPIDQMLGNIPPVGSAPPSLLSRLPPPTRTRRSCFVSTTANQFRHLHPADRIHENDTRPVRTKPLHVNPRLNGMNFHFPHSPCAEQLETIIPGSIVMYRWNRLFRCCPPADFSCLLLINLNLK